MAEFTITIPDDVVDQARELLAHAWSMPSVNKAELELRVKNWLKQEVKNGETVKSNKDKITNAISLDE